MIVVEVVLVAHAFGTITTANYKNGEFSKIKLTRKLTKLLAITMKNKDFLFIKFNRVFSTR
ncbi:hypothetical protein A9Q98_08780 [Thalassotalea sp. 42_200_T64]|nr:hypothetical protein A9Q98_08780 [Thalassotalea sp. 42_200_T64]